MVLFAILHLHEVGKASVTKLLDVMHMSTSRRANQLLFAAFSFRISFSHIVFTFFKMNSKLSLFVIFFVGFVVFVNSKTFWDVFEENEGKIERIYKNPRIVAEELWQVKDIVRKIGCDLTEGFKGIFFCSRVVFSFTLICFIHCQLSKS